MKNVLCRLLVAFLLTFTLASASTIYVGMEDIGLPGGDKDYNDLFIALSSGNLSVVAIGAGAWQAMVTPNEDGTPFWDNPSWDGPQMNAGYFVTGTGGFAGNPLSPAIPVSRLQYWGIGTAVDNSFLLFSTGSTSAQVLLEVSAWSASDQLYWFNAITPATMNLLVPGSATPGATVSFNPSGDFGLKFVSESIAASTCCQGWQYGMFRETPEEQVPEPTTAILLGVGFLAIGAIYRRRQRKC